MQCFYPLTVLFHSCVLVTSNPISVNFIRYRPGLRVMLPVTFTNADMNNELKRGSLLMEVKTFVDCKCENDLPSSLVCDLSKSFENNVIRMTDVQWPAGVLTKEKPDDVVAVIRSIKG